MVRRFLCRSFVVYLCFITLKEDGGKSIFILRQKASIFRVFSRFPIYVMMFQICGLLFPSENKEKKSKKKTCADLYLNSVKIFTRWLNPCHCAIFDKLTFRTSSLMLTLRFLPISPPPLSPLKQGRTALDAKAKSTMPSLVASTAPIYSAPIA